jgi:hypothetical protein
MRQQTCGRVFAAYAFSAWLGLAERKAQQKQLQHELTWHHVQHVQAGVWSMWRAEFERVNPKRKLMTAVYRARRYSTLRKVSRQGVKERHKPLEVLTAAVCWCVFGWR